jgi:DNA-directed RNA polymerase specialized sigma24 family protein
VIAPSNDILGPLIESMGTGDQRALEEFIGHVAPWLHGALLRLSGTTVSAGFLVEETLKELWRTAPLYDPQWGPPMTWTMAVARVTGLAWLDKRRGKEKRLKSRRNADEVLLPDGSRADPRTVDAFGMLDESDRQALRAAWFEGLAGGAQGQSLREAVDRALPALARALEATQVDAP